MIKLNYMLEGDGEIFVCYIHYDYQLTTANGCNAQFQVFQRRGTTYYLQTSTLLVKYGSHRKGSRAMCSVGLTKFPQ